VKNPEKINKNEVKFYGLRVKGKIYNDLINKKLENKLLKHQYIKNKDKKYHVALKRIYSIKIWKI